MKQDSRWSVGLTSTAVHFLCRLGVWCVKRQKSQDQWIDYRDEMEKSDGEDY